MWLNSFGCGSTDLTAAFFELQVIKGAASQLLLLYFSLFLWVQQEARKGRGQMDGAMRWCNKAGGLGGKAERATQRIIHSSWLWSTEMFRWLTGISSLACLIFMEYWNNAAVFLQSNGPHTHTYLLCVCVCVCRLAELTDLPADRLQRSAASALLEGLVVKQLQARTRVNTLHTPQNLSPLKAALSFILFLLSS